MSVSQLHKLSRWSRSFPVTRELVAPVVVQLDTTAAQDALLAVVRLVERQRALTVQLRGSLEHVERALTTLESVRAAAQSLVTYPTDTSLAQLRERGAQLSEGSGALTSHSAQIARLLSYAGLAEPHDPELVLAFREALELLERAPRERLLVLRANPALLAEDSLGKLRSLHEEAKPLLQRRTQLDARIVRTQHADELRTKGADYALALQRPWWLAWLFGLYWAARSLHRRVAQQPGSKPSEMASDLLEASRLLHALETFDAREDARQLLAGSFVGVDSDFDVLTQAAAWAREVTAQFSRLHPAYAALRKLLLVTELAQVSTLLSEARLLPLPALWEVAARAQRTRFSVADTVLSDQKYAQQTLRSVELLEQVGARSELTVGEFAGLLAQLDELSRVQAQLVSARTTLERLGLPADSSKLDVPKLEDTARAAAWCLLEGVPVAVLATLSLPAERGQLLDLLTPRLHDEQAARAELELRGLPEGAWTAFGANMSSALEAIEHALTTRQLLRAQQRYLHDRERALTSYASSVVKACARGAVPLDKLLAASDFVLYQALLVHACEATPSLSQINGSELTAMRTQFRALDRSILRLNARHIAAELSRAVPPEGVASGKKSEWSELALIKHELSKRMRHVPLRQLLRRAGGALGVLKPCFMMSPLSVAQYLPQLADQFDLVVIDEASQMRPEDAVGSIVRARRAVVVGDPKQLPPTSFFQRIEQPEEPDVGGDSEPRDEPIDAESILDLGLASFGSTTDLRWHYRSRHPSLIAFSNQHFYDGRLKVFPAPNDDRSELGLQLVQVHGDYEASTNLLEAQAIAARVQLHVHERPQLSLGVAAMNQKQKDLILEQIAQLDDERVRAFVDSEQTDSTQPFFVKSLENVQGDERDVIFVSLTYGPDPKSKRVYQRFGPLNSAQGARRLNVLLTRARQQLVVFSSLSPADIVVDERSSAGLKSLRSYLVYAESGQLSETRQSGGVMDAPFEAALCSLLGDAGYELVPQVGVQGFFIDMGVRVPGQPGFLCGIECDGPSYHASRSARDRDRLRQEILEAQGWKIVRVWSTDWLREPQHAKARLLEQVQALAGAGAAATSPVA